MNEPDFMGKVNRVGDPDHQLQFPPERRPPTSHPGAQVASFDEFLDTSYLQLQLRDPDIIYANGFADVYGVKLGDQFSDLSVEYLHEIAQLESDTLAILRSYDRSTLSVDQQISYDAFEWYLDMQVRGHAYSGYKFLVNPVWGLQNYPVDFLKEYPLETKQDAENYIARISNLDIWMDQVIAGLVQNEQIGAIPPKYVIEDTITQINKILNAYGRKQPDAKQI